MEIFQFYSAADYSTGTFLGTRADDLYNISSYNADAIVPDVDLSTGTTVYANTLTPNSTYYAQDWKVDQPNNQGLSTYNAKTYVDIPMLGSGAVVTFLKSPQGAIVEPVLDGQPLPVFSTYGQVGQQLAYTVPLNNTTQQHFRIINTGYADATSIMKVGPTNVVGSTMASAITTRTNGSRMLSDTWTFLGLSASQYRLTRSSTGVAQSLTYGTKYSVYTGTQALPGFDLQVAQATVGDSATLVTNAPIVNLFKVQTYSGFQASSSWNTAVLDSGVIGSQWAFTKHETNLNSTNTYATYAMSGDSLPIDYSWNTITPTTATTTTSSGSQTEPAATTVVSSLGNIKGRYAIVTFSIMNTTDKIVWPRIYAWTPFYETAITMIGSVINGKNVNNVVSAFLAMINDFGSKMRRAINSFAISTAEQEYLMSIGAAFGLPKRRLETFSQYRNRLVYVVQSSNSGNTIAFMTAAIQAYLNSMAPYIVAPAVSSTSWILGSSTASTLGSTTILGASVANYWTYDIHLPVAQIPSLIIEDFTAFVKYLNPVGAIPSIILE